MHQWSTSGVKLKYIDQTKLNNIQNGHKCFGIFISFMSCKLKKKKIK